MAAGERLVTRGNRRGTRALQLLGDEFRERRLSLGLTQMQVGSAIGISRSVYSRIENGRLKTLSVVRAAVIGAVLGMDVSVRAYPGAVHLRDAAQSERLGRVVREVAKPLVAVSESPLPQRSNERMEQRAWDHAHGRRETNVDGAGDATT